MKPILFNTETVRAILDGRKTETRRVIKPQPKSHIAYVCMGSGCGKWGYPGKDAWEYWGDESFRLPDGISQDELKRRWTPPCNMGDILYVRETWAYGYVDTTDFECRCNECFFEELKAGTQKDSFLMPRYFYRTENLDGLNVRWHPSIHMPKEAARIFLRVIDVRVERLQDITYEGCKAEGFDGAFFTDDTEGMPAIAIRRFSRLWDSTIKTADRDYFGWEANPWVWVIEFERIGREEAMSEEHHDD